MASKSKTKKVSKEKQQEKGTNAILTVIGIIALVSVAIIIFRLTYAFFTARIEDNNPNNKDVQVLTSNLLVRYIDGDSNIELDSKIVPGDIITKEFSVKNEGNDTGYYTIVLENLINYLGREKELSDLKYTLIKIDSDNNESIIGKGTLPLTTTAVDLKIYNEDSVLFNATNKYRLEIEYVDLPNVDQSNNMGEKMEAKINIIESETEMRTAPITSQ